MLQNKLQKSGSGKESLLTLRNELRAMINLEHLKMRHEFEKA